MFLAIYLFLFSAFVFSRNKKVVSIPFNLLNSYVLIETKINHTSPLYLIYDSGVRNTIITELHPEDSLELKYSELRTLQGLGEGTTVDAFISQLNEMTFNEFTMNSKSIYVLKENYFRFSEQYGTKVNGFLGIDFTRDYITEINYNIEKIRFYRKSDFVPPKSYKPLPVRIVENKIYVYVDVKYHNNQSDTLMLLLDTGAQLNAWLSPAIKLKQSGEMKNVYGRIGEGFGGEINGHYFKINELNLAGYKFQNPIVVCPDSSSVSEVLVNADRDGSLGSEILYRFNLIFDLHDSVLYLKPNKYFRTRFKYNIAGLEVIQNNLNVPRYEVVKVWQKSPAEKAGLQVGDEILKINELEVFRMTLPQVRGYFEQASKRGIKINFGRKDEVFDTELEMIDKLK